MSKPKPPRYREPVRPRYEVQTRSGLSWGWECGSDDPKEAAAMLRKAKRSGYRARIFDTKIGAVVQPAHDRDGKLVLVSVPA